MGFFDLFKKEERGEVPSGTVPVSASNFLEIITGMGGYASASGIAVTADNALGVPAVWAAVNFLSGTLAGLPLHVYKKTSEGREKVSTGIAPILHDAVNDGMSSFEWRKGMFDAVFTGGRAVTFIERNAQNKVMNLWPLDPAGVTAKRDGWVRSYTYKDGGKTHVYSAAEIIDIPFMLKADGVSHRGPIATGKDAIALAIAATEFGSKFFQNGGVPPFAVTGNFQSGKAMSRAADDLAEATRKAAKEQRQALVMPAGLEIKSIGTDAEKSQLVELKRFCIEEIARLYNLPPVFLQDLTHGTFSNTEQQDLMLAKHTLKRWVEQVEQELNLKLFGRTNNRTYIEFSMDGLLRGDFQTRMNGYAQGIQNGILKPNEARQRENLPDDPSGNELMIQGATVPIRGQLSLPLNNPQETPDGA